MPIGYPTIAALHAAYAVGLPAAELIAEIYRRIAAVGDPGIFITLLCRHGMGNSALSALAFAA